MSNLTIRGLGHVAIRVKNFQRSLQWYIDMLGLEEAFRLYRDDGTLMAIYLYINGDNFIELFEKPDGGEVVVPELGLVHVCLHVENLKQTLDELAARGLKPTGEPRRGRAGALQCWITDPDGNRIELMEMLPDSQQALFLKKEGGRRRPGSFVDGRPRPHGDI